MLKTTWKYIFSLGNSFNMRDLNELIDTNFFRLKTPINFFKLYTP